LPTNAIAQPFSGAWQPVDFFGTTNVSTNSITLRPGIERIHFKKTKYVSVFSSVFKPVVETYKVPAVVANIVNGKSSIEKQTVRRLLTRPDIIFAAGNLNNLPPENPRLAPFITARSINYITNGLGSFGSVTSTGPGTIAPETTIVFHKASPQFYNQTPFFLDDATAQGSAFIWGSFDGTTNAPIVYPQGTSIRTVESQVLGHF
jgi:hypothetical protein